MPALRMLVRAAGPTAADGLDEQLFGLLWKIWQIRENVSAFVFS